MTSALRVMSNGCHVDRRILGGCGCWSSRTMRRLPAGSLRGCVRRAWPSTLSAPPVLRRADLTVDRARHRASRGSRPLSLTRKEFGILEMLLAADGAVVSAEELLEHVWDADVDPFSNIVSVTMTRLRRKLGEP